MVETLKKSKVTKKSKVAKKTKGSKRPLNPFMVALSKARAANADSFVYNGKTYYKKMAKTGIPLYSSTKSVGDYYKNGGKSCSSGSHKKSKKSRTKKSRTKKSRSKKSRSKKGGRCGCKKKSN